MANVFATKNGNWSDPTVWNTGALPTSADDVFANGFTVQVDVTTTVLSIRNTSATGINAGGAFSLLNDSSVNCTAANGFPRTSTTLFVTGSLSTGQTASITGLMNAYASVSLINHSSAGTVNVVISMPSSGLQCDANVFVLSGPGTLNLTGNLPGTFNFNSAATVLNSSAAGTINITGSVTGGGFGPGVQVPTTVVNNSTGNITIVGNLIGSAYTNGVLVGCAAVNNSTGILTVIGSCTSSATPAIGVGGILQKTYLTGPFLLGSLTTVSPVVAYQWRLLQAQTYYESLNVSGTAKILLYTADNIPTANYPVAANVRHGTVYGPTLELTGSLRIPAANQVAAGVQVDNTTGTAVITSASLLTALGMASGNLDAQLAGIPAAVWSATTRTLTEGGGGGGDPTAIAAAVWSAATRTVTGGTVTASNAPDATAIASAVNTALDRTGFSLTSQERQAIATAVEQSILNDGDGQAVLNAIVGAIGNQNIDQIALVAAIRADLERTGGTLQTRLAASAYTAPPSATDNASAVWSATTRTLTTGGGGGDAAGIAQAVWSATTRTITGGTVDTLTSAPDVPTEAEIADAVRAELSPELARMSNAATTQEVDDIVTQALGPASQP